MNADHVCWHPVGEKTMTSSVEFMLKSKYDALVAELAATQDLLPFSAQELAARAKALEADRDQISLTLAVAKADRDKWFGRAKALEKEQWLIAECIFQNVSAGEMKHWAQGIKVSLSCADEVPRFTVETDGKRCTCDNEDPFKCKCRESSAACHCVCHGL